MTLTIGSLFSGIGGLELGLERAGLGPVLWQAEQDEYCRRVLAKHWPEAQRYEDVRDIDRRAAVPDIICGGFPCQDISVAGKGAGLAGERSGLWGEYARIVRELRPRFIVVENVSALLGRGLGDVLGDLAACGYDAEWDCIPAAAVGAPHRRDRLFVIGWRVGDSNGGGGCARSIRAATSPEGESDTPSACTLANGNQFGRQQQRVDGLREGVAVDGASAIGGNDANGCDLPQWPPAPDDMHAWGRVQADAQPAICRVAARIPDRSHRLRALGNAVVPAVAEVIGRLVAERAPV